MIEIVAGALVNADPGPATFISRQGFEPDITTVGPGSYRLRLSSLSRVSPFESVVLVTPAIDGCLFQATLIDDETVAVAFTDAAGAPKEAQFNVAVARLGVRRP